MRRLPWVAVAALGVSCIDLGGAEEQLCQERPGLCPNSPGGPTDLQILGWPEPCRTLQLDVGTWAPVEPTSVEYRWLACDGDSEQAPCVTLQADATQPYLTVTENEVGKHLRGSVVTQQNGRTYTFTRTVGPVQTSFGQARETLFFTGFEAMSLEASNVSREGSVILIGQSSDAHWGTSVMEVQGADASRASLPIPGGASRASLRFAFRYIDALPGGALLARIPLHTEAGTEEGVVEVRSSDNRLELAVNVQGASAEASAALQLIPGAWYEVELSIDASATSLTRVQWSAAETIQPSVQVSTTRSYALPLLQFGAGSSRSDYRAQFDDVVIGLSNDGFPMGDLRVEPLRVDGVGQHSNDLQFAWTTNNTSNGTQYVAMPRPDGETWQYLTDWPVQTGGEADGVLQYIAEAGAYVEYTLGDVSGWSRAQSIRAIFAVHGASGPVASITGAFHDGTNVAEVFSHDLTSPPIDTSVAYRDRTFPRALDYSSGWTTCSVNALRARFGYSQTATNLPMLDAVMAEVLVIPL